jgi:hypothetical protein
MDAVPHLSIAHASPDPLDRNVAEIDAAIGLVVAGLATRVRLVRLTNVNAESLAAIALARTQSAGLRFDVDRRTDGAVAMTVGPLAPKVG